MWQGWSENCLYVVYTSRKAYDRKVPEIYIYIYKYKYLYIYICTKLDEKCFRMNRKERRKGLSLFI